MSEFEEVTAKAMALPPENRAELAELLIQTLEGKEDQDIKFAWLAEIGRREQEIQASEPVTKPAEQALREARES